DFEYGSTTGAGRSLAAEVAAGDGGAVEVALGVGSESAVIGMGAVVLIEAESVGLPSGWGEPEYAPVVICGAPGIAGAVEVSGGVAGEGGGGISAIGPVEGMNDGEGLRGHSDRGQQEDGECSTC